MAVRTRTILPWHRPLIVLEAPWCSGCSGGLPTSSCSPGSGRAPRLRYFRQPDWCHWRLGPGHAQDRRRLAALQQDANRVGVAIGYKEGRRWTTEGWWNIAAASCETLMAGPLVSRFYYIYALDYDQGGAWGGKAMLCTRDKMFTIHGIEDCVARGFERTGFFEVDTGEQPSWTVQLTEPGETGTGGR